MFVYRKRLSVTVVQKMYVVLRRRHRKEALRQSRVVRGRARWVPPACTLLTARAMAEIVETDADLELWTPGAVAPQGTNLRKGAMRVRDPVAVAVALQPAVRGLRGLWEVRALTGAAIDQAVNPHRDRQEVL